MRPLLCELESRGLLLYRNPDERRLRLHLLTLLCRGHNNVDPSTGLSGLVTVNQVNEILRHAGVPKIFR